MLEEISTGLREPATVLDSEILMLFGEWAAALRAARALDRANETRDRACATREELDAAWGRAFDIEPKITTSPATGLAGFVAKVVVWCQQDVDSDSDFPPSLLDDAERLVPELKPLIGEIFEGCFDEVPEAMVAGGGKPPREHM